MPHIGRIDKSATMVARLWFVPFGRASLTSVSDTVA